MRIELVLLLITGFLMFHVYTDGSYTKQLLSYKKYYQMAGIAFGGFVLYWLLKKHPEKANQMIATSHEYLKYLPIDQNTSNILHPILDFTSKQTYQASDIIGGSAVAGGTYDILNMNMNRSAEQKMSHSGKTGTKRSVSETKKKFVAAQQNWKCGNCGNQLSAWFEVDHKVRLEYGGSNHIDNLVALCRECHGEKTTIENL